MSYVRVGEYVAVGAFPSPQELLAQGQQLVAQVTGQGGGGQQMQRAAVPPAGPFDDPMTLAAILAVVGIGGVLAYKKFYAPKRSNPGKPKKRKDNSPEAVKKHLLREIMREKRDPAYRAKREAYRKLLRDWKD